MLSTNSLARVLHCARRDNGAIPFDVFVGESLYGQNGFYQKRVSIGNEAGDAFCTHAENPLFTELIARHAFPCLRELGGPSLRFLELGGGMGSLKKRFKELKYRAGVDFSYLSLDISKRLIDFQKRWGKDNIQASAISLPLADRSIRGVIFANELFDALPFKVVRAVKNKDQNLFQGVEELYYVLDKQNEIQAEWRPVEPNSPINNYWERQQRYFQSIGRNLDDELENGRVFCINLYEETLLRELNRVLAQGEIIIIDYGDELDKTLNDKGVFDLRMYPKKHEVKLEQAHQSVYLADLTTDVNFTNLMLLAEELDLETSYQTQSSFMKSQLTREEETMIVNPLADHPWHEYDEVLTKDEKEDVFKVLILRKG
ncbi:SAM-dependent methyltransferase [Candidatus Shapirobacteria bacterium]|nr:SAM-dependent methyltransferase [Candidatus Shapirobacteria bacterium]